MLSDEKLESVFNDALVDFKGGSGDSVAAALRAVAEAAVKDAVGGEPVAWEFQHEDTGLTMYECPQQVEWGFEKNNPRWKKIGPVYRRPQASQLNLDYLREMGRLEARIRELEQASAAVPDGFVMVPVEPTQEIIDAICHAKNLTRRGLSAVMTQEELGSIYRAMLAAS